MGAEIKIPIDQSESVKIPIDVQSQIEKSVETQVNTLIDHVIDLIEDGEPSPHILATRKSKSHSCVDIVVGKIARNTNSSMTPGARWYLHTVAKERMDRKRFKALGTKLFAKFGDNLATRFLTGFFSSWSFTDWKWFIVFWVVLLMTILELGFSFTKSEKTEFLCGIIFLIFPTISDLHKIKTLVYDHWQSSALFFFRQVKTILHFLTFRFGVASIILIASSRYPKSVDTVSHTIHYTTIVFLAVVVLVELIVCGCECKAKMRKYLNTHVCRV